MSVRPLARAFTLPSGAVLKNRLVKSAMSEALSDAATGAPGDRLVRLYERLGRGGAGLLITGNVSVDLDGRPEPGVAVIQSATDLPAMTRWAQAAKAHGSKVMMQINHAGRQTPRRITRQPVAPSAIGLKGKGPLFSTPRALTDAEIGELIRRWARAAELAQRAGFDGVQVHAAHGYLISQFLSPLTNTRTDRWGGDLDGRMRLLLEVVRAIRTAVGREFTVAVKLNSADFQRGGFSEDDSAAVVRALEAEGIDLLEISGGSYESSAMMGSPAGVRESTRQREAYFLTYAERIRKETRLPLLLTGGMRTAAVMDEVLEAGHVDLIGLARPLAFAPDLPRELVDGTRDAAPSVDLRTGVRTADDMLQIVWYQAQLWRMADGAEPDPALSKWRALASGFLHSYAFNPLTLLTPRPPQRALTAVG